jgi:hypothetical protein
MRTRHRRPIRLVVAWAAALVAGGAAALVPAAAANAADGTGWSGYWYYTAANSIEVGSDLPGVHFVADGYDIGGRHDLGGQVEDTAGDGACARVELLTSDRGFVADRTVCDGQPAAGFDTGEYTGDLTVYTFRVTPDTTQLHIMFMPTSANDPGMRETDTGYDWSYYTSDSFQFHVHRSGVSITGFGRDHGDGNRTGVATVEDVSPADCVSGQLGDGDVSASGSACGVGNSSSFSRGDFSSYLPVTACETQPVNACLRVLVPIAF